MKQKYKKSTKNNDFIEIFGFHAVNAALKNSKRIHQKLTISERLRVKFKNIKNLKIKVNDITFIQNDKFNKIYGNDKKHQGIILKTSKLKQPNIEEIISQSKEKKSELVVMLDQVTDPHNIGSIIRSCALFNCHTIITTKKNAPDITSSITQAASGAIEMVNYIKVNNLSLVIEKFKKNNFWVVGFDNNSNHTISSEQLPNKCLMIFGSESTGLRKLTIKTCDLILKIPQNLNNKFEIESLNVANACSIAIYEHFKVNN